MAVRPDDQRYVMPDGEVTGGGPSVAGDAGPEVQVVEGARVLANESRETLCAQGLSDDEVDQLADEYAATHPGEAQADEVAFVAWVRQRR